MFNLAHNLNVFSSPIKFYDIHGFEEYRMGLRKEAEELKSKSSGLSVSNYADNWHSQTDLTQNAPKYTSKLVNLIPGLVSAYAEGLDPSFDIQNYMLETNGWYNVSSKSGYHAPHTHSSYHLSGVFYVKQPRTADKRSGFIEFINSKEDYALSTIIKSDAFKSKIAVRPPEGSCVIFPSTLLHYVHPNLEIEDRITFAWNIRFVEIPARDST
jgi:uncharacterized protein (TIGR02466 family)